MKHDGPLRNNFFWGKYFGPKFSKGGKCAFFSKSKFSVVVRRILPLVSGFVAIVAPYAPYKPIWDEGPNSPLRGRNTNLEGPRRGARCWQKGGIAEPEDLIEMYRIGVSGRLEVYREFGWKHFEIFEFQWCHAPFLLVLKFSFFSRKLYLEISWNF